MPLSGPSVTIVSTAPDVEVESMERRTVDPETVKRAVARSTADSAWLEGRELPADFVRSASIELFLAKRRKSK
jgi:hypothetical protein